MSEFPKKLWTITDFLSQYTSDQTKKGYRSGLRAYFKLFYPELRELGRDDLNNRMDELCITYLESDRDIRNDLITFRDSLHKLAPKTRAYRITAITRYFEDNGITFPRNFIKNLNGKGSGEAISDEHVPSNEDLASLVEFMPIQAKTLTMVLASSGMRIGEAMQLRLDDLDLDRNPARIKIRGEYSKNGRKRITFVSSETLNQLRDWLNYRQQFIEILKERGKHRRKIPLTSDDDRVFPFSVQNFSVIWKKALKKAGLYKTDKVTNRITLHPHNLRKFFRTYGRWTNPDVPEALMGHQSGLVAIYARYDQAEKILEEVYLKAERNLSLYEHSTTMLELREKMEAQDEYLDDLIKKLYRDNSRLEGDLQSLNSKLAEITEEYEGKASLEQEHLDRIEKLEKDFVRVNFMHDIMEMERERFLEKNKELNSQLKSMNDVIRKMNDMMKRGEDVFLEIKEYPDE